MPLALCCVVTVLRHMARVGDFREAFLSPELVAAFGSEDKLGPTMVK